MRAGDAEERPIVLALPRGGVVTAFEIARALRAPLDVLVVRKLGAPAQPEFGVGAIAPGGVRIVDRASMRLAGMDDEDLERVAAEETRELERRERRYRAGRGPVDVRGRTAILVDDGVATGVTARAAIATLRKRGAARIILAVGVCPPETAERLRHEVDDLVCVLMPEGLTAVGPYFDDFRPVADEEVVELLKRAAPVTA
ncbi:MAG TPA: phosphoribosyltransferase family protein [Candidatus Limnocylindria bacterium]|nr:phosphoribosyltransferase family protein [Candidatus Limnocylindria bacterium]